MSKAKKLSVNQEVKLLRLLKNSKPIGNGSSRLVFIDPRNDKRVVKVAVGACSFRQNKLEVKLWNTHQDERLATIYEYGRFVVVMERMDIAYDSDDEEVWSFDSIKVVDWLNEIIGETMDNWQLGTVDGNWKSYDYGFDPETPSRLQCGEADSIFYRETRPYLNNAITLLRNKQPVSKIQSYITENY